MTVPLSGRLIGREAELAVLRGVLTHRPAGTGAAVVLRGEAGVGKSRLVRETLEGAPPGSRVLVGRASEGTSSTPYRALHELAVAAIVSAGVDTAALGALSSPAQVLAGLHAAGPAESLSPIVVAEAVLALARGAAATPPVLVIEDAQWADPDTATAIEHLVARAGATSVVVIVTIRTGPGEPGGSTADRLRIHPGVVDLELVPLEPVEILELLSECLGQPPPSAFASFVADRADGLPLLVEALVEGAVAASVLRHAGGRWQVDDSLSDVMPMTFASSVQRRLDRLGPDARLTVEAAALVGRYFEWADVTAIAGLDPGTARAALRELADAGFIVADKNAVFAFRHALGRDAVLRQLLPSDRQDLARRGVAAIDATANPALAGSLAELAGDRRVASMHLVGAARRALTVGALTTAEETLWRAWDLDPSDEAADSLLEALTLQGRADEAIRLGRALGPRARHPAVALRQAKAALAAGDWTSAASHLDTLRTVPKDDRSAGVHLVAAELALQRGDFSDATAHAERAHEAALRDGDPTSVCEALELAGRAARPFDLAAAESAFERAYATAVEQGLEPWRLRALHELGTIDLFSTQRVDRLIEARVAATAAGAMRTLALVDLHLAAVRMGRWELDEALEAAQESIATSKRFHLPTHGMALVMGGTALALAGRHRDAEEAAHQAIAVAPDDLDVLAGVEGRIRALAAAVRGDLDGGLRHLDAAMAVARRSAAVALPVRGLWALLTTARASDEAGHAAIAEVAHGPGLSSPLNRAMLETAQAIRDRAAAAVEPALAMPGAGLWFVAFARLVVADYAARSGWGDPARWAQDALAFFGEASGQERLASSARGVLRRAGVAVPRRGRGDAVVPRGLRAKGVTSREMDVLLVVAEGLTNAEIGERLHLSARTVEKHVSSLLAKTDTRRRAELVAYMGQRGSRKWGGTTDARSLVTVHPGLMTSTVDEVAPDIYRISVFVPEALSKGFTFNQFLIDAEEPLLFSTGMRWMFPEVRAAVERILPAHRLRWVSSGHASRADEFGALAQWLAVAPEARVVHGQGAVMVQLSDMVDHQPRVLAETEVLDLGTRRVRYTSTPFVQGPWEAGMLFEETTATLLCGDLFAYEGATPATTTGDIVSPAFEHQDSLGGMPLTPHAGSTIRRLADVAPERLALMHGATYTGDCPAALRALADGFDERLHKAVDTAA